MKVRHWNGEVKDMTPEEAIDYELNTQQDNQLQVVKKMLSSLVQFIGEDAAIHLLKQHGSYHKPCDDNGKLI
jgi:hypothetical protein